MTDTLKTVQALVDALQHIKDHGNAESARLALASLTEGRALIAQLQREAVQPPIPEPARRYAERHNLAVTTDWCVGWDACRNSWAVAAPHPEAQALDSQLQQPDGHSTPSASEASTAPLPDPQLCKFYAVETWPELVAAMERHITKLQAKLAPTPSLAPQRVREG